MKRFAVIGVGAVLLVSVGVAIWQYGLIDSNVENVDPSLNLLQSVEFYPCKESRYYVEHGVEVLNTDTLDDYLASETAKDSSVCFRAKENSILGSLKLVWYSKDEAPKSIEVLGVTSNGSAVKSDVLWSSHQSLSAHAMNGFYYSELKLASSNGYSDFRINYISGAKQDRLLLRAAAPFFKVAIPSKYYSAVADARRISQTAPYGVGTSAVRAKNPDELVGELRAMDSLHCGNYSYLLAYELDNDVEWSAIGAISKMKAAHTVVEIRDSEKVFTADPTLGAIYPCAYADMQTGNCNFDEAIYTESYNPIHWPYSGENFYPGAQVQIEYSQVVDYYKDYRKL